MKVLFYINPFFVRGTPSFYDGAIKNKISKQALKLHAKKFEIFIIANEFNEDLIAEHIPYAHVITIKQSELFDKKINNYNVEKQLYEDCIETKNFLNSILREKLPNDLDYIIAWETPADFLKDEYNNALIIHEMPGFISRVPYPELLTFDPDGLFNKGNLNKVISTYDINPKANELLNIIRHDLLSFIDENNPFSRCDLDPEASFNKLVLLPLQITDQYAFLSETSYKNQLALMVDVLEQTPKDIGVIVTQYKTGYTGEEVLNEQNYESFKKIYPNLIWSEEFSKIDNSSQYLLASVDAVATVSSSIGLQALLWEKPLISICNNYLTSHSQYHSISDFSLGLEKNSGTEKDHLIKWILTYYQPLVSQIFNSHNFLPDLMSAIKNKGDLVSFYEIDEDYNNSFIKSIKKERAESILKERFPTKSNGDITSSFKAKISQVNPDVISFDIFDTLIDRKVEQPSHIFNLIERKVEKLTEGKIPNFCAIRQASERYLRGKLESGKQEISLKEIFEEIQRRTDISTEQADQIMHLEVNEEIKNIDFRSAGRKLYNAACETNAKIILISDMYLDNVAIKTLLRKSGYPDIKLYLSSDIGLRKHEGDLFDYVSDIEKIDHSKWLHVGDNPHGDIKVPLSKGIHTFHIVSAFRNIEKNKKLFPLIKNDRKNRSLAESALYGMIQRKYFDDQTAMMPADTHAGGDSYKLGYIAIAPMMFGFLQWIMSQAKNDGVQKLLFLSRDGKVLYRMAQVLFPKEEGWPEIEYALSSRRSARVASIFNKGDISELMDSAISNCSLKDFFAGKFGFDIHSIDQGIILEHGFKSYEHRVSHTDRDKIRELSYSISNEIIEEAKKERELLVDYYVELGVTEKNNIGLVDIGYAGTMQTALEKITTAKNIKGYYYVTFDSALNQLERTGVMRGYAGEFIKRQIHHDPICNNGFLYETIFCSSDSSFISFKENHDGEIKPVFLNNQYDYKRRSIVEKMHNGCVAFARDIKLAYTTDVSKFSLNSITASKIFNDLLFSPSGRDAEIFEGCVFEDAFSGSKLRYIVPPRDLILQGKLTPTDFIWKEGTAVFSRRPDLFPKKPDNSSSEVNAQKNKLSPTSESTKKPQQKPTIKEKVEQKKIAPIPLISNQNISKPRKRESLEIYLINKFIKSENKKNKYFNDRELFFSDSKSKVVNFYWNRFGKKI